MKVAMLSSEFPPKWGGVGVVAYFHVITMAREYNIEYNVLTRKMMGKPPPLPRNVSVHMVPFKRLPMYFATSFGSNAIKEMTRMKGKWDMVHIEGNMTLLDEKRYRHLKAPIITTMHGTWRGERSQMRFADVSLSKKGVNDLAVMYLSSRFDKYEDLAIKHSDVVVAISKQEERALKARGVVDMKGELVRINHGVDTTIFSPRKATETIRKRHGIGPDQNMVLFVGRLAGRKGLDTLVQAFERISKEEKDTRFVVIGSGPRLGMIRKQAKKRGFKDKLSLVGSVDFEGLAQHYATADVVLFPSRWEGYGLITLEAMASGTPVIASRVGAAEEIISDGKDGYLVDIGDSDALSERALRLLKSPDKLEEFARASRRKMKRQYTWEIVGKKYHKVYSRFGDG